MRALESLASKRRRVAVLNFCFVTVLMLLNRLLEQNPLWPNDFSLR